MTSTGTAGSRRSGSGKSEPMRSAATKQQQIAAELSRRLDDITRLVSDWVWETNERFEITYVSERVFEVLGVLPVMLTGKTLTALGTFFSSAGKPTEMNWHQPFRDVACEIPGADGKPRLFLISGLPVYNLDTGRFEGVRGTARDVTAQRAAERALREQYEFLQTVIDAMPVPVFFQDKHGVFLGCNTGFEKFHGLSKRNLVGKIIYAVAPEDAFQHHCDVDESLLINGGTRIYEAQVKNAIGDPRDVIFHKAVFARGEDARAGLVGAMLDITELKRAERALRDSEQRHRDFASDIAHELRTPLAVLRTRLDTLDDSEEHRAMRDDITAMSRLLHQMLAATRLETLATDSFRSVDLRAVCARVAMNLGHLAIQEGRSIEIVGCERPVMVLGDAEAIEQAIRNLVENAIKYSAKETTITIDVRDDRSVRVVNCGPSIPKEKRDIIFKRFERADRRADKLGLGIGLAIVKRVVDAHGARVEVEDAPGGGAVFALLFPPASS